MAKLILTVALLFFVIALSHAHRQILPENVVASRDLRTNVEESDEKKATTVTLLLPSERFPDSESANAEDVEVPQKTESETNDFVPRTVINFRPISRQFPQRPPLTLRQRRPCRHHRLGKPWGPIRIHHHDIPYGNDMLTSSGGDDDKEVTRNPTRWMKFHHGDSNGPRFPHFRNDGEEARREEFKGPGRFRHRHHHHHHGEGDEMEREGHEHKHGFLMKIRKFLNHS